MCRQSITFSALCNLQEALQDAVRGAAAVREEELVHRKSTAHEALSIIGLAAQKMQLRQLRTHTAKIQSQAAYKSSQAACCWLSSSLSDCEAS